MTTLVPCPSKAGLQWAGHVQKTLDIFPKKLLFPGRTRCYSVALLMVCGWLLPPGAIQVGQDNVVPAKLPWHSPRWEPPVLKHEVRKADSG